MQLGKFNGAQEGGGERGAACQLNARAKVITIKDKKENLPAAVTATVTRKETAAAATYLVTAGPSHLERENETSDYKEQSKQPRVNYRAGALLEAPCI